MSWLLFASCASALTAPTARGARYVDELLKTVDGTDRGVRATAETRSIVDGLVSRLERSYDGVAAETPEWLYRECEVAYVGQRDSRNANAAGGKFRGRLGRVLFRTTAMYQHVLDEGGAACAVNFIKFRLLGLLPGSVVLRGRVEPETDLEALGKKWNRTLSRNTIRAAFQSPRVALGPVVFDVGPTSDVRLDTTYLDERIRVSRGGSSGTVFVFKACEDDAAASQWKSVCSRERTTVSAPKAGAVAGVASLAAAAAQKWIPAAALALVAAKLLTSTGGIVVDDEPQAA